MRALQFVFFLGLTLACIQLFNRPSFGYPPLGRLLDPISGFWRNAEPSDPANTTTQLAHLQESVEVHWRAELVPHIVAQNESDLYYAQGYLTAQHRLWSMEWTYLRLAGKRAARLGSAYLEQDRLYRRLGLGMAAERAWKSIQQDPPVRQMIESYTLGINAYIQSLNYKDYPMAYKILNYVPEAWSPTKTCLLLKGLEADMSIRGHDLAHNEHIQSLGRADFDFLYPAWASDPEPVIPAEEGFLWNLESMERPVALDTPQWLLPSPIALKRRLMADQIAIGRTHSADSSVMVAHSVFAPLTLPAQWYLIQLESPKLHLTGGTIPGIPGILIGASPYIAWGFSPTGRDIADWYRIELNPSENSEYHYNGDLYKIQTRIETFEIRGEALFYDTVRYTHHGPIVYDSNFSGAPVNALQANVGLALRWAGHLASNPLRWVYAMAHANSYRDVEKSLNGRLGPHQYILLGSAHGPIALWAQGRYPNKWVGQGRMVLDGTQPTHNWQSFIPDSQRLSLFNPKRGFISAAGQRPMANPSPTHYADYGDLYEEYRGRRLNERLKTMENIQPADLMGIQTDHFNYLAYDALPLMLDSLHDEQLSLQGSQIYQKLRQWDYFNRAESNTPTYFAKWFDALHHNLWDELTKASNAHLPSYAHTVFLMKNYPNLSYYDQKSSLRKENLSILINESFEQMNALLQAWQRAHPQQEPQWGNVSPLHIPHPIGWKSFGMAHIPMSGGMECLNRTQQNIGAAFRFIVHFDPSGQTKCWATYPGGQPENPAHPKAKQLTPLWQKGEYISIPLISHKDKNKAQSQLLKPKSP